MARVIDRMSYAVIVAVAGLVSCMATALQAATYTVDAGETFTLDSSGADNASGNRLDITGSATLKLTGSATNGAFPLKMDIRFTSAAADAVLTVDAADVPDCTSIRMTGNMRDNSGSAVIALPSAIGEFVAGSASKGKNTDLSFPAFEPDVSFAGDGSVVFTNDVSVVKLPTCDWRAASGARLATLGPRALGGGDFTLASYDVELCNPATFDLGSNVTVQAGRTLYVRPAVFNNAANGTWVGTSTYGAGGAGYITNNFVLGGSGAKIYYQNNNDIYGICGTISGTGNVYAYGNGDIYMRGAFDWTGSFTVGTLGITSQQKYVLYPTNCATIVPAIVVSHSYGGDFRFYPTGSTTGATELRLTSFAGNGTTQYAQIRVDAKQTITVGAISGTVRAWCGDASAKLVVESLAANSTLYLRPNLNLTVKAAGAGAKVVFESVGGEGEKWFLSGPDSGEAISPSFEYPANAAETAITFGGRLSFPATKPIPFGTVTIREGAEISANIAEGTKIVNEGGTLTQLVTTWRDKVTLWVDASVASTFSYARELYPSKTQIALNQMMEWRDCRESRQGSGSLRIRVTAFDSTVPNKTAHYKSFPYVEENDSLSSVRMDYTSGRAFVSTGVGNYSTVSTRFALLVFNSKNGGGNALLGTSNSALKRRQSPPATPTADMVSDPIVYANNIGLSVRTNGVAVADPTDTPLTGGWQIIALAAPDGLNVGSICSYKNNNDASYNGGQIYAEILLFTEMPTDEERDAMETYLSKKWNLPIGHEDVVQKQNVTVALSGSGTVSLASDAVVSNGMYSGAVNLNGHRLQLSTNALPYTEATLPAENRVLWVDPSATGAIDLSTDETKADEVAYLYSRDNVGVVKAGTGYYLTSPYVEGGVDRRIRCVLGSRANGPALPWLVFAQKYSGDTDGNHLIIRSLPASPMTTHTDAAAEIGVKAGFFALDTTAGGGTVIATRVNGSGDFALRQDKSTEEIFKSTCSEDVRAADAWLDEAQIDPSSTTYTRKPEVFAFNMQEDAPAATAKVIGFYGQNNREIIGEFMLYSTTQTPTVCKGISAYLMKKWLGKLREGFSDFRDMTVSGDGVLAAEGPEYLPALTEAFTGSLEFSRTTWSFTLPQDGGSEAVDKVDLSGRTVALPAEVTVNLDVTGTEGGKYLLMRVGSFSGETTFTLGTIVGQKGRQVSISESNGELYADVVAPGMLLIVK